MRGLHARNVELSVAIGVTGEGNRRGRPKADPLDYLRTKVWCAMLARFLGVTSAYAVAAMVDGNLDRLRTWQRHFKGETRAFARSGIDDVKRAETKFPGTARFYNSAIWHVLRGGRLTASECHCELVRQAPDLGFDYHVDHTLSAVREASPQHGLHIFAHARTEMEIRDLLLECPTYDGLQALIILVALAEQAQNRSLRNILCITYRGMLPELIKRRAVPFHSDMFDRVDLITRFRRKREGLFELQEVHASWRSALNDDDPASDFDLSVRAAPTPRYDQPWRRSK